MCIRDRSSLDLSRSESSPPSMTGNAVYKDQIDEILATSTKSRKSQNKALQSQDEIIVRAKKGTSRIPHFLSESSLGSPEVDLDKYYKRDNKTLNSLSNQRIRRDMEEALARGPDKEPLQDLQFMRSRIK
eukprot:TRINITY_DN3162_c0_g1_i8.p2 TRINITY_DN3162_c0_g1~~TRINITY_DN3162_c0_g1_i8.p2  ORF type:complete len:130 (-),score=13.00 TRINITY_DN3162_c0_g1_i8:762-1151(-)